MITIDPEYLKTFLVWLTGGNKEMSVDVTFEIGMAIEKANVIRLAYVQWTGEDKKHGVVWWYEAWIEHNKSKPEKKLSGVEIAKQITAAIEAGDIKKAMELQKML